MDIPQKIITYFMNLGKDLSLSHGGLGWFAARLITHAFILFFVMQFVSAFFTFNWNYYGMDEDRIETLDTILFAVALLYFMVSVFPMFMDEKED